MSSYLVDTHALLWFLGDPAKLSPAALLAMESEETALFVSAACVWEIAIKASLGKLRVPPDLLTVLRDQRFEPFEIRHQHAWKVRELSMGVHKDPFDRLLVAQALVENLPIISHDTQLDAYGAKRLW